MNNSIELTVKSSHWPSQLDYIVSQNLPFLSIPFSVVAIAFSNNCDFVKSWVYIIVVYPPSATGLKYDKLHPCPLWRGELMARLYAEMLRKHGN